MSYVLPTPRFIQESIVMQIKRRAQRNITATQAVQAFMICKTGCCNVLGHYYTYYELQTYIHTRKLISLLISIMAAVFESLPGKLLALLKSSSSV